MNHAVQTREEKTMTIAKESKRILSVAVIQEVDTDPDTSYYGEYASLPSSVFSIDRAHSEECAINNPPAAGIQTLEHAINYLLNNRNALTSVDDEVDLLQEKIEELQECDCEERGDMNRGEYRYFNPSSNYVDRSDRLVDGNTAEEVRKYVRQDYERMEAYNAQQWCYMGVYAQAQVQTGLHSTIQTIRSGGLWGTESDSDKSHFEEIEKEELATLKAELHAIGFSKRAITAALRNVERKFE